MNACLVHASAALASPNPPLAMTGHLPLSPSDERARVRARPCARFIWPAAVECSVAPIRCFDICVCALPRVDELHAVALPPFVAESAPLSHDAPSCRESARAPHCHPTLMRERVETVCVCFVARAVAPVHYLALHCNCASLVGRIPPFSGKGVSLYQRGPPRHAHASPTPRLAPDAPVHSDAAASFSYMHRSAIASVFPLDWRRYMSPSPLPLI